MWWLRSGLIETEFFTDEAAADRAYFDRITDRDTGARR